MTERDRPCKSCQPPIRYPGCHSHCPQLSEFNTAMEEQRQRTADNKQRRNDFLDFKAERISKTMKRYGGHYADL